MRGGGGGGGGETMTAMAMSLENMSLRYLYFLKIVRSIFEVILFHDFAAPFLQNGGFDLQTGRCGQPVLANGKHSKGTLTYLGFGKYSAINLGSYGSVQAEGVVLEHTAC